ncbi:hypothetical protein ACFE04_015693 [Oxalis oulophora]
MACFDRASPTLKEIILKIYRAEKPLEIDHHAYEFGSVEYHIKSSASEPYLIYLSISTPLLSQEVMLSRGLSDYTEQMIKEACSDVVDIVQPAKEGFQVTLKLDFRKLPRGKGKAPGSRIYKILSSNCQTFVVPDSEKAITAISTLQAVILSSQLKEMLRSVKSKDMSYGMYKAIKLVYHPKEPFYVIRQPENITIVFPMRFKEYSDVIIATAFFQELIDVGNSKELAKAPLCCWSPIPPPELRGEAFEDLNTNGGFISFDILSRHVKGKRLDKTVWSLLNFYGHVKYHIKCTKGFIQRRMRKRLETLVQVLQDRGLEEHEHIKTVQSQTIADPRCRCVKKIASLSKSKILKQKCGDLTKNMGRFRSRLKIQGFERFRKRWLKCSSLSGYTKLD